MMVAMLKLLFLVLALLPPVAAALLVGAVAGPWVDQVVASWSSGLRFWLLIGSLLLVCLLLPLYLASELYFRRADKGKHPSWANTFLLTSILVGGALIGGALLAAPVSPETLLRERVTYLPRLIAARFSDATGGVPDAATAARLLAEHGEDGDQQMAQVLMAVLEEEQFTVELELEAHVEQDGARRQLTFGEGLVALDLRGGPEANQRLELHLQGGERAEAKSFDVVLVVRGTQAFLWAEEHGQEALVMKLDLAPYLQGTKAAPSAGFDLSDQLLARARADVERLRQDPRQALSQRSADYGSARLVAPGVLKLRSKDSADAALLYFDPSNHLPRLLVVHDPRRHGVLVLHMKGWRRGVPVDATLPQPEQSYVAFESLMALKLGVQLQQLGEAMQRWGKAIQDARE